MFESLSDRLGGVFDRLRGRGALTEADVRAAMREVRVALANLPATGSTLAISIEPRGGSPTGQPTGPVVAAGTLERL